MAKVIFDSEEELELFVYNTIDESGVCPLSGDRVDQVWRQVNLGEYGVLDILKVKFYTHQDHASIDLFIDITVLELKKEVVDMATIGQVMRYIAGIKHYMSKYHEHITNRINVTVYAEIAAPLIKTGDDTVFIINEIENLSAYQISCDLAEGFSAENKSYGWHKTSAAMQQAKKCALEIRKGAIEALKIHKYQNNVVSIKGKKK